MPLSKSSLRFLCFFISASTAGYSQSAQSLVQQVVTTELAANQSDHSNWVYLEEIKKPKEHLVQWVAATQGANVDRVILRNDQRPTRSEAAERNSAISAGRKGAEEADC